MEMYFVLRVKEELSVGRKGRTPDLYFLQKYMEIQKKGIK